MKYVAAFAAGAVMLAALGAFVGGVAWLLLWPALNLALLALIYYKNDPGLLGKQGAGRMAPSSVLLFLPYLSLTWVCWFFYVRLSSEPWAHEIADGVWVGRRPDKDHLPPRGALVVDLTAEFPAAPEVVRNWTYISLPVLEARAPAVAQVKVLVARMMSSSQPVYIYCAQGHGRSASLAAGLLVARGVAADARAAEARMKEIRPGIRLHRIQRRIVDAAR
ncbi:MAG: hypothetical protein ACI9OJ_006058 [Myxococcota bacterium]|jgi:hypothetical protein